MLKFWHIQAILLFFVEYLLVHDSSRDKVQFQSMAHLDITSLVSLFRNKNSDQNLVSPCQVQLLVQRVVLSCPGRAMALDRNSWTSILMGEKMKKGLYKSVMKALIDPSAGEVKHQLGTLLDYCGQCSWGLNQEISQTSGFLQCGWSDQGGETRTAFPQ